VETVSATEFKNRLGSYLQGIARDPIVIEKSGKPVAVLLSHDEYDRLVHYEDYVWAEKARRAEESGEFLGHEETMKFLLSRFVADEDAPT